MGRCHFAFIVMLGLSLLAFVPPAAAQRVTLKVRVDGTERTALVYPGKDAATTPSPVVLAFHELGGAAAGMALRTRLHIAWPEATVVYPQGLPDEQGTTCFSSVPGDAGDRDPRFVDALLQTLGATYKVDERRIYASGFSNGAHFVLELLVTRPERFSAFAPVAGAGDIGVRWAMAPRPVLLTIGQRDLVFETERTRNQILRLNDCGSQTTEWLPEAALYQSCRSEQPVILSLHNGTHVWPTNATANIVRFFKEHALVTPPQLPVPPKEPHSQESVIGTGRVPLAPRPDGTTAAGSPVFFPTSVALDPEGNTFYLPRAGTAIRKIGLDGKLGRPILPDLWFAEGVVADLKGNLYVADTGNRRVLRITPQGAVSTVAGTAASLRPGSRINASGDGGPAIQAELSFPIGIAVDPAGNLYLADSENHRVRKIDANGMITTVAGTGLPGFSGDGGPATGAQLYAPSGLAIDRNGDLWIADAGNHRLRTVSPDGKIATVAGTGARGFSGDGGQALTAQLNDPIAVAVDSQGNAFVADSRNHRIRKIAADGIITTVFVAGAEQTPYYPASIAIDRAGNLLVVDPLNHRIWKVAGMAAPGLVAGQPFPTP